MKKFSTWMVLMLVIMFWVFRILVALFSSFGDGNFLGITPTNETVEIALLFVVLLCMILIVKRKFIGAIIYLIAYGAYFGVDAGNNLLAIMSGKAPMGNVLGAVLSIIGIILPIAVLLDMIADSARKANPRDKKTDWFYKNEKFDRELDERADKNNYRL